MLSSITLTDFKSYRNATLKLAPLTVLIGANASGKSNAIEALRLLSWIAQGNKLSSIRYAIYEGDQAMRGTTATLSRNGAGVFAIDAEFDYDLWARTLWDDTDWNHMRIKLARTADDELRIIDERVTSPTSRVPLYEVVPGHPGAGSDLRVAYNNFARGGKKPQVTCSDQMAILLQMQSAARFE